MKTQRAFGLFLLILCSVLGLISPVSLGADEKGVILILPESAYVQGTSLLLGEIAAIEGEPELAAKVAAINAGAAPQFGSSRRLTKGQIEVRLRQGGLDLTKIKFAGEETVQVFRLAPQTTAKQTDEQVKTVADGGALLAEVVVAVRDLPRGTVLTWDDLMVEERDLRGAKADGRGVEHFIGLRTSRHVLVGAALTSLNVETIPVIERGAKVTIVVQTKSLVVTAPGIARGTGGLGEVIAVENTLSKQVVYGEILDAQTVQVNIRGSGTP